MIFDKIENLYRYDSLHPAIPAIRKLIKDCNLDEDGQFEDPVKYNISTYTTSSKEKEFEWHCQNADLQLMLRGEEKCQFSKDEADMNSETFKNGDIAFMNAKVQEELILSSGTFVIYFPGELHKPSLNSGTEARECRKAVFKLPSEGFER